MSKVGGPGLTDSQNKREVDFSGEFPNIRRSNTAVDGKRVISDSVNNPLKRLKLIRFADNGGETGAADNHENGDDSENYTHTKAENIRSKPSVKLLIPSLSPNKKLPRLIRTEETHPLPKLIRIQDSQSDPLPIPKTQQFPKLVRLSDDDDKAEAKADDKTDDKADDEADDEADGIRSTSKVSNLPKLIKIVDSDRYETCESINYDKEVSNVQVRSLSIPASKILDNDEGWDNAIEVDSDGSDSNEKSDEDQDNLSVTGDQEIPESVHYEEISSDSDSTSEDEFYDVSDSDSTSEDEFHDASDYQFTVDEPNQDELDMINVDNNIKKEEEEKEEQEEEIQSDEINDSDNQEEIDEHHEGDEDNEDEESDQSTGNDIDDLKVTQIKSKLYAKLTGKSPFDPYGLEDKIKDIYKLLSATVEYGERNSCFIFGPRNCGKTAALEAALRRVKMDLTKDEQFIQIRLNGLAQDDDKLAVRAIAEQLDSEISRIFGINLKELDISELLSRKSINVTFANILKILDNEIKLGNGGTGKIKNPIVFIIDEVDVYANQSRQTLLYNLFDLVENSPTPICVLCSTTKFTVKEYLEKRVRSRFSQRLIQFQKNSKDKFIEIASKILSVDEPENNYEELFNENVQQLLDSNSNLRKLVTFNYLTTGSIKHFLNSCIYPVSQLCVEQPFFQDAYFNKYEENISKGSLRSIVNSLSDLELFLLISAARVIAKRDINFVNLNLTYEEYELQIKIMNKEATTSTGFEAVASTGHKQWSKIGCKTPWETLQTIGLLTLPNANSNNPKDVDSKSFETQMWQVELTLDELRLVVDNEKSARGWTRL